MNADECWNADHTAASSPADSTLKRCLFGVWGTQDVLGLFDYIKSTKSTARPLRVAGIDVQISSLRDTTSPSLIFDAVKGINPTYALRAAELDRSFLAEDRRTLLTSYKTDAELLDTLKTFITRGGFIPAYDSLLQFMDANAATIRASFGANREAAAIARQVVFTRAQFARQLATEGSPESFETRDRGMADNIDFLLSTLFPDQKIMVWAHNAHIQHDRANMIDYVTNQRQAASMGTWVSQRHRAELYTIGLFMYTGSAATNGRTTYSIRPALENSLEALLYQPRKRWLFVDMKSAGNTTANAWMYSPIVAKEWGVNDYRMTMRDQFDAVLFIHTVTVPPYL
jgi:erythromycin esterase